MTNSKIEHNVNKRFVFIDTTNIVIACIHEYVYICEGKKKQGKYIYNQIYQIIADTGLCFKCAREQQSVCH